MIRRWAPNRGCWSMMGFLKHYQVLRDRKASCIIYKYKLMSWDCALEVTPPGTPFDRFTNVILHLLPKCAAELTFGECVVAL